MKNEVGKICSTQRKFELHEKKLVHETLREDDV
jgi:hypothetical protein